MPQNKIYTDVLSNKSLFPRLEYSTEDIYAIIKKNVNIPPEHLENRPDKDFKLWKNHVLDALRAVDSIESLYSLEGKHGWYRFN